jgi:hypothetical protein
MPLAAKSRAFVVQRSVIMKKVEIHAHDKNDAEAACASDESEQDELPGTELIRPVVSCIPLCVLSLRFSSAPLSKASGNCFCTGL